MRSALVAVAAVALLCACSDGASSNPPTPSRPAGGPSASSSALGTPGNLEHYTDTGDGCAQAISAIGYADESLRPLGQEPYQEFDDLVRSKLAAVAGTLALEAKDWPNQAVYRQAQVVQPLAQAAGARLATETGAAKSARVRTLLRYRIEAGKLILLCRDA